MPLILALLGCSTCPTFAEMEVVDESGAASVGEIDLVRQVIEEFAASTGRAGVCVPEVRLVAEGDDTRLTELNGFYVQPGDPIYLQQGLADIDRLTRHELCHAIDGAEGLHEGRSDLFPPDSVVQTDIYDTEDARVGEAFARACEDGGAGVGVSWSILEACEFPQESDARAFLLDEVYIRESRLASVPLAIERREDPVELPDGAQVGARALLGDDLLVVSLILDGDAYAVLPEVVAFDIATGEPTVSVELAGASGGVWTLFTGDGAVVAVEEGEDGTRAWLVDVERGAATLLPNFPAGGPGVAAGGLVWRSGTDALYRYGLEDAALDAVPWPVARPVDVTGWAAGTGGIFGATVREGLLQWAENEWQVRAGLGSVGLTGTALSGDRWILTSIHIGTNDFYRNTISSLLLYDLDAEEWVVPADPCGLDGALDPEVFANGEEAWIRDAGGDPFGAYSNVYFSRVLPQE